MPRTDDHTSAPVSRRSGGNAAVRLLLAALIVVLGLVLPGIASAHAFLVRTTPRPGERLGTSPPAVVLDFSEPIVSGSARITVRTSDGVAVALGPPEERRGGAQVWAPLPPLDDAIYRVGWQVLADDGHASAGEFAFAVGAGGAVPTTTTTSGAISWPDVALSWLLLLGLALGWGGLASEVVVWSPVVGRGGFLVPRAPVAWGLLLALAGAGGSFLLLAARGGTGPAAAFDPQAWRAALGGRPGAITAVVGALVAYALWILARPRARAWALAPLGVAVLATAWRGHPGVAAEAGRWWEAVANGLHVAGATLWVGALVHLALTLQRVRDAERRSALAAAARRYAALALPTVFVVLVGGVITAIAELRTPADLVATAYGRVLLVKLGFVAAALGLALAARLRALPAPNLGRLGRLTRVEGAALLGAIALSAVLGSTATPGPSAAAAELLGPPPLTGPVIRLASQAGQLAVFLAAAEGELQLWVIAPGGEPAGEARVQVEGRSPSGAGLDLYPRTCGRGCFSMGFPWPEGTTHLRVTVSGAEWTGGRVEFAVPWPPALENPQLLERVVATMRAQPEVWMTERVSSGPGMATGPYSVRLTGPRFVEQELYVASGADDVHLIHDGSGLRSVVFWLPGSWTWYRLWIDDEYRVQRETIVNSGHLIERAFSYGPPSDDGVRSGDGGER